MKGRASAVTLLLSVAPLATAPTAAEEKVEGYAEFRADGCLLVDAQRVCPGPGLKFKGEGDARDFASVPLGYEAVAKGMRRPDGALLAREFEAKPNGEAMFEDAVRAATDLSEQRYRRAGRFYEEEDSEHIKSIGRIDEEGPRFKRARRIVDSLLPPYLSPEDVRVYVIANEEWNAFAMGNLALYVFSGLLDDMGDDEVAIVLGHELAHATHEHTRREVKKQMWIQLAAEGVMGAVGSIDDDTKRIVLQLAAGLTATAWSNGYGRSLEDQADRVGLRYAYEAGYDVTRGPRLWNRFARKYGQPGKVANFFFGDHSQSSARAAKLEKELARNYRDGAKPGGLALPRATVMARSANPDLPRGESAAGSAAAAAVAPTRRPAAEIHPGMSPDDVRRLLGPPTEELLFGEKTRWTYPDRTVIFENGTVKEVR
jgi:Zn-dependent protease with chaperone function